MGILGPKLNLRIIHSGHPHYFYNRKVFEARDRVRPHYAPYYGALLYGAGKYTGGPVETAPVTYLIFWGWSGAVDNTADPDGLAPYMVSFFQAMPSSSWLNTVTQYYQNLGSIAYITNPAGQYGGASYDPSAVPSTVTGADYQNEALKYANATLGYSALANYIVVTPTGHTLDGFNSGTQSFCAYHDAANTTSSALLSYTVFPYLPDVGYSCGVGSVNNPGTLDGVSIVGGHEEAETITDPTAYNGWLDSTGYEIADKCAWYQMANTSFGGSALGTNMFPTQPLWSNAAIAASSKSGTSSACVQSYSGTPPSPTPSPSPTPIANVVANPGFETGHLKPWGTCHSMGRLPAAFATTQKPHSGKYDAYAGTVANGKEPDGMTSVCQLISVPAGAKLTVWLRGISNDKRSGVYQFVRLYNTSGTIAKTLLKFDENDKKWVKQTVNLSAYGNGQYVLAFGIQGKKNAHGHVIGLFVDGVSIK